MTSCLAAMGRMALRRLPERRGLLTLSYVRDRGGVWCLWMLVWFVIRTIDPSAAADRRIRRRKFLRRKSAGKITARRISRRILLAVNIRSAANFFAFLSLFTITRYLFFCIFSQSAYKLLLSFLSHFSEGLIGMCRNFKLFCYAFCLSR